MSSDSPESAQNSVSVLLYRAILSVWARFMAWETDWMAVDRNLVEAVESDCDYFIVAICVLIIFLRCFFSNLVGVLDLVHPKTPPSLSFSGM